MTESTRPSASSPPPVRYVRTDDGVDVAYWKMGRGPVLLHSPNVQLGHLHEEWSVRAMRRWYEALARRFTLVRYDHRGGGMSTRGDVVRSIDALVHDVEAVASAVSDDPVALLGWITGGLPAIAFAARNVERVSHLLLWNCFARNVSHGEGPRMSSLFTMAATDWELFTESICHAALGWSDAEESRRWAVVVRKATTQEEFLSALEARRHWDVSAELLNVVAPTLVMHDATNALADQARSRELAAGVRDGRFLTCQSRAGVPADEALGSILGFLGRGGSVLRGLEELTPREREVVNLLVEGATNAEIAERLFISVNTVTRHLTHIYAKTGSRGRADAVRYALERGARPN